MQAKICNFALSNQTDINAKRKPSLHSGSNQYHAGFAPLFFQRQMRSLYKLTAES